MILNLVSTRHNSKIKIYGETKIRYPWTTLFWETSNIREIVIFFFDVKNSNLYKIPETPEMIFDMKNFLQILELPKVEI